MRLFSVKRALTLFLVNRVLAGTRCFGAKRRLLNGIGHSLGLGTSVVGPVFLTGTLITGEDCWIGRNLQIHGNGTVRLGKRCDLGPDVTFLTGGHTIGGKNRRAGPGERYEIRVGDGCWIGARCTLGRNVSVGRGSVIAACAGVFRDVPPNTLAAGLPAREIRRLHED